MTLDDIVKGAENKPIIILSGPRTGSTLLGTAISKKLNVEFFNETAANLHSLHKHGPEAKDLRSNSGGQEMARMFMLYELSKQFVLKEHTLRYLKYYPESFRNSDFFIIRLHRKNILEQILSSYIANQRQKWFYHDDKFVAEEAKLSENRLLEAYEHIKKFNWATENYKGHVDVDVFYEDLIIPNNYTTTIPTVKPLNITELTEWASNVLGDKL